MGVRNITLTDQDTWVEAPGILTAGGTIALCALDGSLEGQWLLISDASVLSAIRGPQISAFAEPMEAEAGQKLFLKGKGDFCYFGTAVETAT
jgi:hypothetical protein